MKRMGVFAVAAVLATGASASSQESAMLFTKRSAEVPGRPVVMPTSPRPGTFSPSTSHSRPSIW